MKRIDNLWPSERTGYKRKAIRGHVMQSQNCPEPEEPEEPKTPPHFSAESVEARVQAFLNRSLS